MPRLLLAVLMLVFCAPAAWAQPASAPTVYASVAPAAYLAGRVAGGRMMAEALVRPGQEPHDFEPTARQMAALAQARVYFTMGLPFEGPMAKRLLAANPKLKVVDASAGIKRRMAEDDHGHGHGEPDPHIWLSPRLAARLAENMARALAGLDPAGAAAYVANLTVLKRDLARAHKEAAAILARFKGASVLVYHPAFGYFLEEYGLRQVAVQKEGKEPGARGLAALIEQARSLGVKAVFVQAQFPTTSAQALARELGAKVIVLDPLAPDYLANLRVMAERIASGLAGQE